MSSNIIEIEIPSDKVNDFDHLYTLSVKAKRDVLNCVSKNLKYNKTQHNNLLTEFLSLKEINILKINKFK